MTRYSIPKFKSVEFTKSKSDNKIEANGRYQYQRGAGIATWSSELFIENSEISRNLMITNGNADLEMIGISDYFDYILTPAELNTHKPDPLMFEAAVKATGFKAGEICHVGDHPINDVKASYEFGNKSIWFKENGKELDLDIEVPSFSHWRDLPGLLEKI